ncbi:MAG: EndoU domain-containing protein [Phormidium sp.]
MASKGSFHRTIIKEINIDHIYSGHSPEGIRAKNPTAKKSQFPTTWSKKDIKKSIERVWQSNRTKRKETQICPIDGKKRSRYRGIDSYSGLTIEVWYNNTTKTIETAYPVQASVK